jgi:hypothetical protein
MIDVFVDRFSINLTLQYYALRIKTFYSEKKTLLKKTMIWGQKWSHFCGTHIFDEGKQ